MPKIARELTAKAVDAMKGAKWEGLHAVGGAPGLHLRVVGVSRSWVLRVTVGGKRRDIGLGSAGDVSLAAAREKARAIRSQIAAGVDPVEERAAARAQLLAVQLAAITFDKCAERFIADKKSEWKNAKQLQQWENTIATYAGPFIGSMRVADIDMPHVLAVLEPIWGSKTETASRLRGRIEQVLDWATVHGYREGLNPARWRGHLDKVLSTPSKIAKVKHHAALPFADMPTFISKLRSMQGTTPRAVEFAILTAARSGEVRGMTWAEVDADAGVWTVPAERMKAGREHRVALSPAALALLAAMKTQGEAPRLVAKLTDLVFPGTKLQPLSDMSLGAVLKRMKVPVTVHGFRSTFRDWAAETTNYPNEVVEMALAHGVADKVEAAYRRGDLFDKRRGLMSDWANYIK